MDGGGRIIVTFSLLVFIAIVAPVVKPYESLDFYYVPWILMTAICGIIFIHDISSLLNKSSYLRKPLIYLGERTMDVLTWHFFVFKMISALYVLLNGLPLSIVSKGRTLNGDLYMAGYGWLIYTVAGVIIPILLVDFTKRLKHTV